MNKSHSRSFPSSLSSASFDLTWTDTNICLFLSRRVILFTELRLATTSTIEIPLIVQSFGRVYEKQLHRISDVSNKVYSVNFQKNVLEEQVA